MRIAREKEKFDQANRLALQEIEGKLQEIQNEERKVKEQITLTDERFKIREELAEAEARIDVCTRFEGEEKSFRTIEETPCGDNAPDRVERFLQSQSSPDASPLTELEHPGNFTSNQEASPTTPVENQAVSTLNPDARYYTPPTANDSSQYEQGQPNVRSTNEDHSTSDIENPNILQTHLTALNKLVESHAQSRLPLPKPEVFNGDPLKFPIWLKAFETLIETRATNSTERLHFLGWYVGGEAKDVIDGYMLMDGEDAYL
ncbi:Hypothetical predicted protein [Paramuricea clavata]|uniref:Uncharacterized protein n=1 Tax=Paramuricea clavata TaxID=317549 RepID=A0A7D9E383_PARCT|nr:Hypothetical predicted protein [Paramuricea clavata]